MGISLQHNRAAWAWALYDWANSTFATTVLAGFFPVLFKQYWAGDMTATQSTFWLGLFSSAASLLVMLISPWLGAIADRRGAKKRFLLLFTLIGVLPTLGLFWAGEGQWLLAALLFAAASVGFFGGLTFYDALLVDVAGPEDSDRVSAWGYALGYLGGGLLFALNVVMATQPEWFGLASAAQAVKLSFVMVAIWWTVFALPLFIRVRERPANMDTDTSFAGLFAILRQAVTRPGILTFLLAYWLYIDAVHTTIRMAVDFGMALGFDSNSLIAALLMVQFIAFPAAVGFGYLGERIGTRKAIYLGLLVYVGVTAWGYYLQTEGQFFIMAAAIGLVQGGVQALSRSFYSRLIPAGQAGAYFGLFNMIGKFAAVLGPLLVGLVALISGSNRVSILSLLVLFVLGAGLLTRVREPQPGKAVR
ncbi:MFS transporter [Oceanisphaera psychrotolerans]|uniref:MFS transporter n=1 Tax=Oceanisphaera psychrotolerans TaxID=1414654 RepID=A0A1J4QAW5_9GAMM|nr:MFS transporter [Oceanisphaera psychrotolerans]OIN05609.1 MFS transporter [Oceanisphaera psychrotolerans]